MDTQAAQQPTLDIASFPSKAIQVITNPTGFYRTMPRAGGFVEPLVFALVLSLIGIILQLLLGGIFDAGTWSIGFLFLWPILAAIGSFIGAGILYGVWLLMGSQHSYETAYRCMTYMAAISPVTAVFSAVPYLGTSVSTAWA
ncbi:MAG: hypothetical protein ACRERD_25950, partial [Candidatus Binatia bacterium]